MEVQAMRDLDSDFKKYFPKSEFTLKDFQKKVIRNVVDNGSTLCIMPTGGGKSAIYWMAGRELQGITLVVSPLTALIAEQAEKLTEQGCDVLAIYGEIGAEKQTKLLRDVALGSRTPQFIFLSPEKLGTDGFLEYCLQRRRTDIKLVVLDEVHCVSQWGNDFRPFYRRIPDALDQLFGKDAWAKILALTATLNPKELKDICDTFHIDRGNIVRDELLMRSEIQLHVQKFSDEEEKTAKFWDIVKIHDGEKILVYVYRKYAKRGVEDLCQEAQKRGYHAEYFHGDLSSGDRMEIIERVKQGDTNLIFATNAFGMGIDIPDIRVVIHFMLPESVEQYYQEVGRAARDGNPANAYLLYTTKNIEVKRQYFIDGSFPTEEKLKTTFDKIYPGTTGIATLAYFGDEDIQQCLPYYLNSGLIQIVCKGFSGLSTLTDIEDEQLQQYYDSSRKKGFITTLKRVSSLTPEALAQTVYEALVDGKAKTSKPLERWLIIDVKRDEIDESSMRNIMTDIAEKKAYKHDLLNYFVKLLEEFEGSPYLHQDIAYYLGTSKHSLNLIHKTADGHIVRSKSEVIIANLLYQHGVKYEYEEKLFYGPNQWIEPDFTIYLNDGRKLFWEHIGLLGQAKYDNDWLNKLNIYDTYFPNQLVKTYESGALSVAAEKLLQDILGL